jgi:DNA replication protein DnaC
VSPELTPPLADTLARLAVARGFRGEDRPVVHSYWGVRYTGPSMDDEVAATLEAARAEVWRRTIPSRFTWAQPADLPPEVADDVNDWALNPDGRNLLLFGPVGTGKTHAAVAAVRGPFDQGAEVRFTPVVELLDWLRPGGDYDAHATMADLAGCDVLLLDDLGAERPTDWTAERLYALVNRRWLEQLPTVVTTNLEPEALQQAVGERLYSRLADAAVAVRLSGEDRRRHR